MSKKGLFKTKDDLVEFLFNTYGDGSYLMDVRKFYDKSLGGDDLLVDISNTTVYVNEYNSKDELIEELNMVIDDTMPIDKVIKLGKLVKGICSQDDSTRIDSLSLYAVTLVIKGRYTTTLRIEYDTVDTITVMYV